MECGGELPTGKLCNALRGRCAFPPRDTVSAGATRVLNEQRLIPTHARRRTHCEIPS